MSKVTLLIKILMNLRNFFILLILMFFLNGCGTGNIEKEIANRIENCQSLNCTINISTLTSFKWDKMYVFNYLLPLEEINKAIGMDYPYWEEYTRPMIFLYKNKIVHYENNPSAIESINDGQVLFDYPDNQRFKLYTPDKTIFKAKMIKFKDGTYFELSN